MKLNQYKTCFQIFLILIFKITFAQVTSNENPVLSFTNDKICINEFMHLPESDKGNEWIEIFNKSNLEINIKNWKISDRSKSSLISDQDIIIPANEYLVIGKDSSFLDYWNCENFITCFEGLPSLNNSGDVIVLSNSTGQTIDSIQYTSEWAGSQGVSLEKRDASVSGLLMENWGLSKSEQGGTPGKINTLSLPENDLKIIEFSKSSSILPAPNQEIEFSIKVSNVGEIDNVISDLSVGCDINLDGILNNIEVISTQNISLMQNDSISLTVTYIPPSFGSFTLIAQLTSEDDVNSENDIMFFSLKLPFPNDCLCINEFMYYDETGKGGEWIELYNKSEEDINLNKWNISDNSKSAIISDENIILMAKDYIVIVKDATLFDYWECDKFIPCFEPLPSLNNSGDSIKVTDPTGKVIDALEYKSSWGNQRGVSLEKKNSYLSGMNSENWGLSNAEKGGTPGKINTLSLPDNDLIITSFLPSTTTTPIPNQEIEFIINVKNLGGIDNPQCDLIFGCDENFDGILSESEIQTTQNIVIGLNDSVSVSVKYTPTYYGLFSLIAQVQCNNDVNPDNNTADFFLKLPFPDNCICINEFMYYEEPNKGGEWIEVFNKSNNDINLKYWSISDNSSSALISMKDIIIPSKDYIVISDDSTFLDYWDCDSKFILAFQNIPSLNNSTDSIIITDPTGKNLDYFEYSKSWGYEKGVSLERRNPYGSAENASNWGLSVFEAGGSPGRQNSILAKEHDLAFIADNLTYSPENILPGDLLNFHIQIQNLGLNEANNFSVEIRIYNNPDSVCYSEVLVEESYSNLMPDSILVDTIKYFVHFTGIQYIHYNLVYENDEKPENNTITKILPVGYPEKSIIINEIMYNPNTGKPEWFEIYNITKDSLNMKDWLFRDSQNTIHSITTESVYIPPDSFGVITHDENFIASYPDFDGILLVSSSFPTLNNLEDSLIILDPVEHYIDSLCYKADWGGTQGYSLERKSDEKATNSFLNWGSSQSKSGSTPGYTNSIAIKDFDLAVDSIFIDNSDIIHNDEMKINVIVKNTGSRVIRNCNLNLKIYKTTQDSIILEEKVLSIDTPHYPQMIGIHSFTILSIPGGVHSVIAEVSTIKDSRISNNKYKSIIKVGYPNASLIVNEILYSPESGESEWFEIYNTQSYEIDLNLWEYKDASGKWLTLCDTVHLLKPDDFIVICGNEDFVQSNPQFNGSYIIPSIFPTLNNSSDALLLRDCIEHEIDSIYYLSSWGGEKNISIERRNPYTEALLKNNWGSCIDSLGSTPGFANSILKYDYDLSIVDDSFLFDTLIVDPSVEIGFSLSIQNNGIFESGNFTIKLFNDKNLNNITEQEEMVWSLHNIPSLNANSIKKITGTLFSENSGRNRYISQIENNSDENHDNNTQSTDLLIKYEPLSLVINEFLFAPNTGQTEYIELINTSDENIDIIDWTITNEWRTTRINKSVVIPPKSYVVLCEDSSFFNYFPPTNSPVIVMDQWSRLNNIQDNIVIRDLTGVLIDSLRYHKDQVNKFGVSLEKILPFYLAYQDTSWMASTSEYGGTPGFFNSISPFLYDLRLFDCYMSGNSGNKESIFDIKFYYSNIGMRESSSSKIDIYEIQYNSKSLYKTLNINQILPNHEDSISTQFKNLEKGNHNYLALISWSDDQNRKNDSMQFTINIAFDKKDLLISEFMPFPHEIHSTGTSISEYIEIYNPLKNDISLNNWKITDANTAKKIVISTEYFIPSEDYIVIAADSSVFEYTNLDKYNTLVLDKFPSLNNSEDMITIVDPTGNVIDSLAYNSTWEFSQGISKEKIYIKDENLHNNWRSSVSKTGGSPGFQNSVVITQQTIKTGLFSSPTPFTPNGDGIDDEVGFQYQLSYTTANIKIEIYDLTGRLIATPVNKLRTGSKGVVYWNGINKYNELSRIGMYIVRLTATDTNSRKTEGFIDTFVLARGD